MSEYNIQMNKYNALNAGYDQLYPATKIENVDGLNIALQNKAPLTKSMAMIGDMPSKIAVKDAGWYRAIKMVDALAGYIVHIGHSYNSGGASDLLAYVHPYSVNPQVVILTSSKSPQSSGILIDDLRITQVDSSHTYYLDIHYSGTAGINTIFLDAIASVQPDVDARSATQIMDLSAVADAPDGETVIATAEWQSPPMKLGEEYRTTERYLGKPVYCMTKFVGEVTANTLTQVIFNESDIGEYCIRAFCVGKRTLGNWENDTTSMVSSPSGSNTTITCDPTIYRLNEGYRSIRTYIKSNANLKDVYCTAYYTKWAD